MNLSIDDAKTHPERTRWVKYRLKRVVVYQSPAGHCFTDHLDHADAVTPEVDEAALTPAGSRYLRETLAQNRERIAAHVALAGARVALQGARALDVGSGPGAFLVELRERGAEVEGLELSDASVLYARREHALTIHKRPLSAPFWHERHGSYDLVTLWDVLEHLDFPARNLREAAALLKPGGYLMLDTPCRDGLFHRIGELTYALSAGRYPTLLELLYGAHRFGHKQILSEAEIKDLLEQAGLEVVALERIHELALPIERYVQRLAPRRIARWLTAPMRTALHVAKPWNKIRAAARRPLLSEAPPRV